MLGLCCKRSASFKLQTLNPLINFHRIMLYSTSTSTSTLTVNAAFTKYLVNTLGLTQQQALSTSAKFSQRRKKLNDLKFFANANSVVHFLKQLGFNDTHVKKVVSLFPRVLCSKVDKTLNPKVMFLQEMGFSRPDLIRILSANPYILLRRLNPIVSDIRAVMGSHDNLLQLFGRSHPFMSSTALDNIVSNVALLKNDYGVDIQVIRKNIHLQPAPFMRDTEFFQNVVIRVEKELGVPPYSRMFSHAIHLLCSSSNKSLECKRQVFRSFGWTEYYISELIRRRPIVLALSEEKLRKKLGFLMNELGYNAVFLISRSALLTYSLEKRMIPRHQVLRVLKEKGLSDYSFYHTTTIPETKFLQMLVEPFKQAVPGLLEIYQNSKGCPDADSLSR